MRNVAPHGECVIVPGDKFDPDWEFQLEDQGFKVHLVELDRRPVALVSMRKTGEVSEERTVYTPPPKPPVTEKHEEIVSGPEHVEKSRGHKKGSKTSRWTQEEDTRLLYEWPRARGTIAEKARSLVPLFPGRNAHAITCHYDQIDRTSKQSTPMRGSGGKWSGKDVEKLITLWNGPMLKSQIEKAFPGRTPKSVRMLIQRLKKAGKIEKRQPGPRNKTLQPLKELHVSREPEKVFLTPKEEVEIVEKVAPLQTVPIEVVSLLREIRDLLAPRTFYFQWHCRNCKDSGSAEDSKVWKFCSKCGEELVVWDIQGREINNGQTAEK